MPDGTESDSKKSRKDNWLRLLSSMTLAGLVSAGNGCSQEPPGPGEDSKHDSNKNQHEREDDSQIVDQSALSERVSERQSLVRELRAKGIESKAVLEAVSRVPRHRFVPEQFQDASYEDAPLPIGLEQTISQPFIVAYMTESLELSRADRVLEVGTGSGYQSAVLSGLVERVYSVELLAPLAKRARANLAEIGVDNVEILVADGYRGWPEKAPFDAIIVTAAPKAVPQDLIDQLAEGGRLVIPVGDTNVQWLIRIRKRKGRIEKETLMPVRFVPLVPGRADSD